MGRNSIKAKLLKSFLFIIIAVLLISAVLLEAGVIIIRGISSAASDEAGNKAGESSEELLREQIISSSAELIGVKTDNIDSQFQEIIHVVSSTADYITYMYNNKELFSQTEDVITVFEYQEALEAEGRWEEFQEEPYLTMHWLWNKQSVYEANMEAVDSELRLVKNLEGLFLSIMTTYDDMISTVYLTSTAIGEADGGDYYNVGYDKALAIKYAGLSSMDEPGMDMENSIFLRDWYNIPLQSGEIYISTSPDNDMFGRGKVVTICKAYYEGEGASRVAKGVFSVDMYTTGISDSILDTVIGSGGYALLCSVDESSGELSIIASQTGDEDAQTILGNNYGEISAGIVSETLPESGYYTTTAGGKEYYVTFDNVENVGWVIVALMSADEIAEKAAASSLAILSIMTESVTRMDSGILILNAVLIGVFVLIIVAVIFIVNGLCKRITAPIVKLEGNVRTIGQGNLDYKSDIHTADEVESLSVTFERMTKSLKNYIENLNKVTADKERIATELNVATHIQASMLPCIFPPFPENKEFDIFASMQPAKEVGGDFYDFFLVDKTHLGFVIADVSGKGVPAALFMVIAKTLIKNHAQAGLSPAEVFNAVNSQLCENNEAGMFVTGWMGLMEIQTGKVKFVNAGHNPPLICRKGGEFEYLRSKAGFVLAGMEGFTYKEYEMELSEGDMLFLYTDGVTEATDPEGQLFGEKRLKDVLDRGKDKALYELLPMVKNDIDIFVKGADQFDDITMLSVRYYGADKEKTE